MKSVCVCVSGFAPRSIKYTHESIKENIIKPLKRHFNVDVFMFSLLSKNNKIDTSEGRNKEAHTKINNNDIYLLNTTQTKTEYQEDIDDKLNLCKNNEYCKYINLEDKQTKNFLRDLYQEQECFKMIDKEKYDACVMIGPDFYVIKPIDINEVNDCINNDDILYTTSYNDCGGIANKFYIGNTETFEKICSRKSLFNHWLKHEENYYNQSNIIKISILTTLLFTLISVTSGAIYTSNKYIRMCMSFIGLSILVIGILITTNVIQIKKTTNPERFMKYTTDAHNIYRKKSNMFYIKIRSNGKSNWYIKEMNKFIDDEDVRRDVKRKFG